MMTPDDFDDDSTVNCEYDDEEQATKSTRTTRTTFLGDDDDCGNDNSHLLVVGKQQEQQQKPPPSPLSPPSSPHKGNNRKWPRLTPYFLLLAFGACYLGGRPYLLSGSSSSSNNSNNKYAPSPPAPIFAATSAAAAAATSPSTPAPRVMLASSSSPPPPLQIEARSADYGALSPETLHLYGFDLVLEAGRLMTLEVVDTSSPSSFLLYDWHVKQDDDRSVLLDVQGVGPQVELSLPCTRPGSVISLTVTEYEMEGEKASNVMAAKYFVAAPLDKRRHRRTYQSTSAVCKQIRREMRALTATDRETYLDSLNLFYRTPLQEGQRRYGLHFVNNGYLTAAHNTHKWCLHDPNQFLAVHSAFVFWGEENMKRVAEAHSHTHTHSFANPYWDFHIDTKKWGARWWVHNPWFVASGDGGGDDGLGPVNTSASTGHVVDGSGRFAWMPMAKRGDGGVGMYEEEFNPGIDQFGLVTGSPFTLNDSPFVTRSATVCGLEMALPFAPAQNLFDCYDAFNTWKEATSCMYMQVHLQLHSHLGGGAWNCAYDLGEVHEAFPQYSKELLSFLGVAGRMTWSVGSSETGLVSYRKCEMQRKDEARGPRCACPGLDVEGMSYEKLYALMHDPLRKASVAWPASFFVGFKKGDGQVAPWDDDGKDEVKNGKWQFIDEDGMFFPQEDQDRLLRIVARLWCEAAVDGHFVSMASINDPVFYVSHVYFDRLAHFLALSPQLAKRGFNRNWDGEEENEDDDLEHFHQHAGHHECKGSYHTDSTPFKPYYFTPGGKEGEEEEEDPYRRLSMQEVDDLLHPKHPALPYMYDDLVHWGEEVWEPRETM